MNNVFIDPAPISPRTLDDAQLGEIRVGIAVPQGWAHAIAVVIIAVA
jgi:hypothetical protein